MRLGLHWALGDTAMKAGGGVHSACVSGGSPRETVWAAPLSLALAAPPADPWHTQVARRPHGHLLGGGVGKGQRGLPST